MKHTILHDRHVAHGAKLVDFAGWHMPVMKDGVLIGADQNSGGVAVSDIIKEGQTVQFHLRDANAASEELNLLLSKSRVNFANDTPQGALLFSCNGRGRNFFNQPHHDIETVLNKTGEVPVAGFFAGGGIGPVGGQNFIHGYTASVAIFSEPGKSVS